MRTRRMLIATMVFLTVGGSIGGTMAWGAYHRSDAYRLRVENWLTRFFMLPGDVGSVRPRTFNWRELRDVQIWLPGRRDRIFQCPLAILKSAGSGDGTIVLLDQPVISVGSEAWEREDYGQVLRASLAHNFRSREVDVREVRLSNARILWPRKDFRMEVAGVEGAITFDQDGRRDARLASHVINDTFVNEPIQIYAKLDPTSNDLLPEVVLAVPPLPVAALGLGRVLGSTITQGTFAGRITLHKSYDGEYIRLSGFAHEVKLEELTRSSTAGPVAAVVDLKIDEALINGQELDRLIFSGEIRQLDAEPLLSRLNLSNVGGTATLNVREARLIGNGIESLAFSGEWNGATLEPLLKLALGKGGIQGQLRVLVHSLVIRDNQLVEANVEVQVIPPAKGPGTIDRSLLLSLLKEKAGLKLPEEMLPPTIEFTQMGARLLVDGQRLRILSVKGPKGPPLITAKLLGVEVPLLADLDQSIDLKPLQQELRKRIELWRAAVRERIRVRNSTSRPS